MKCFPRYLGLRKLKQLGLHVDFAKLGYAATQLKERLHALENAHMCESDLPDKFQLRML
jgi:hypothetical protein